MEIERDLGPQPIAALMEKHAVRAPDLVVASDEQITHKMVRRAMKGRRLSAHVMVKIKNALNAATEQRYALSDLFTYKP